MDEIRSVKYCPQLPQIFYREQKAQLGSTPKQKCPISLKQSTAQKEFTIYFGRKHLIYNFILRHQDKSPLSRACDVNTKLYKLQIIWAWTCHLIFVCTNHV